MKISEAIKMANLAEPGNVLPQDLAILYLEELDGLIQAQIMDCAPQDAVSYDSPDQELLMEKPYDKIYVHYLVAMIRQFQQEFEGFNNAQAVVQEKLEGFREWYVAHYCAHAGCHGHGYEVYLSAYSIAVKLGFQGTEEEWIESLHGAKGEAGEAARMRFDDERGMIQWGVGDEWHDLFTLEELKDPVVEELMAEVRILAEQASRDKEAANQAANTAAGYATAAGGHAKTAADAAADALALAGRAYASEQAAVTAWEDAKVQAETAEGYAIRAEGAAVGAEASAEIALGAARDVSTAIAQHDSSTQAHSDLRLELQALRGYVTTLLDSDDTTLDQLSEIVGYIKSNRTLIEAVTTGKVSVGDIINDLTTNVPGKPLSAAMGVELAARVGALAARVAVTSADAGALAMVREDGSLGPVKVGDNLELRAGRLNATGGGECSHRPTALVSFTDDDCRAATHSILFPLVQELGVQLTVACAPGELGATAGTYMSTGQLQEMHRAGVEVSCHHWRQDNMDAFTTAEDYAADLDSCLARFAELGIQAKTVAYPQGVYADGYMQVVRERFRAGFGVFRGVNEPPLESYFLRRCELFPTNGAYTLDDAKALVDDVAREGGWLIFMSHAWYPTFDPAAYRELVEYIRGKSVEIVGTSEALDRMGNTVEVGLFRKPVEDLTRPYFVTGCDGRTFTDGWEAVPLVLRTGKVVSTTGPVVTTSDPEYCVSERFDVTGQETVLVSAFASDGRGLFVFYDSDGNRKAVRYASRSWDEGGELLHDEAVAVPEGAATIAVAGYFRQQMPGLKVVQTGGVGEPGKDGQDGLTPHIGANGNWWVGDVDTGKPSQGAPGKDGDTPVKGVDYFTPDDIEEVAAMAAEMVDVPGSIGGAEYTVETVPAADYNEWEIRDGFKFIIFPNEGSATANWHISNSGYKTVGPSAPMAIERYGDIIVHTLNRSTGDGIVIRGIRRASDGDVVRLTPNGVTYYTVVKIKMGGVANAYMA